MKKVKPVQLPWKWQPRILLCLCLWMGVSLGGWGQPPSLTYSPNQTAYCLDGSTLRITIALDNNDILNAVNSVSINNVVLIPVTQYMTSGNNIDVYLNGLLSCGNNLSIEVVINYTEVNGSNTTPHANHLLNGQKTFKCLPEVSYPNLPLCNLAGNQITPTLTNFLPGTASFSVSGNGMPISPANGTIYGVGQNPGSYIINWSGNAAGCPLTTGTIGISVIGSQGNGTLSYGASSSFCINQPATITPVSFSPAGGIFTIQPSTSISIGNGTGVITTTNGTPSGNYTITYTPPISSCFGPRSVNLVLERDVVSMACPTATFCTGTGYTSPPTVNVMPLNALNGYFHSIPPLGYGTIDTVTGRINLNLINTTSTYQLTYTTAGNACNATYPISGTVSIVQTPPCTLEYLPRHLCKRPGLVSPTTVTPSGGTFSAIGLSINSNNGNIAPNNSSAVGGPIEVTYRVGTTCPGIDTYFVYLDLPSQAGFYYGNQQNANSVTFCANTSFPISPTMKPGTTPGGTFTSSPAMPGLNTNGAISSAPPAGTYVVQYKVGNTCPDSATFTIQFNAAPSASLAYTDTAMCISSGDTLVPSFSPSGGVFYSANLNIDSTTGIVTAMGSMGTGGPFAAIYLIDDPYCPLADTAWISLRTSDYAGFYYGDSMNASSAAFCSNQGFADPRLLPGTESGGRFRILSSLSGLATIDSITGQVNFTNSDDSIVVQYQTIGQEPCGADSSTFTIIVVASPSAAFDFPGSDLEYCQNEDTLKAINFQQNGVSLFACQDTSLNILDLSLGWIDLSSSPPGTYDIFHHVDLSGNCADSFVVQITIHSLDTLTSTSFEANDSIFCAGDTIQVNVSNYPGSIHNWTVSPSFLSSVAQTVDSFVGIYYGFLDTTFLITFKDFGFCQETRTLRAVVLQKDSSHLSYPALGVGEHEVCNNDSSLLLPNTGGYTGIFGCDGPSLLFSDSMSGILDQMYLAPPGAYNITFVPDTACKIPGTYTLLVRPSPEPDFLQVDYLPDTLCENQSLFMDVSPIDSIFYFVNGIQQNPDTVSLSFWEIGPLQDGDSVTVRFTNIYGCSEDSTRRFEVHPFPVLYLNPRDSTVTVDADSVIVTLGSSAPETFYDWYVTLVGDSLLGPSADTAYTLDSTVVAELLFQPVITPGASIIELAFTVTAHAFGCYAPTDSVRFIIIPNDDPPIFIPGVFTPNGDNLNDTWLITWPREDARRFGDYSITVFNRAGGQVLSMPKLRDDWNGDGLPDGVYRYLLRDGEGKFVSHGGVTIKR